MYLKKAQKVTPNYADDLPISFTAALLATKMHALTLWCIRSMLLGRMSTNMQKKTMKAEIKKASHHLSAQGCFLSIHQLAAAGSVPQPRCVNMA